MPIYAKLETTALTDAKLLAAGIIAFGVWAKGLLYSVEHLTDGLVPDGAIPLLCIGVPDPQAAIDALVIHGLWHRVEGGYTVGAEKWAKHQTTKDAVEKDRERIRERVAKSRAKRAGNGDVTNDAGETPKECNGDVTRYETVSNAVVTVPEHRTQNTEHRTNPPNPLGGDGGAPPERAKRGKPQASEIDREFEAFREAYPKRSGGYAWPEARARFGKLRGGGVSLEALVEGVSRYRAFLDAVNKLGTEYVLQPPTFLGQKRAWEDDWEIPADAPNRPKQASTDPPPTYRVAEEPEPVDGFPNPLGGSRPTDRLRRDGPMKMGGDSDDTDAERRAMIHAQIAEEARGQIGMGR